MRYLRLTDAKVLSRQAGLTAMELLVVIVVIMIIAGIIGVSLTGLIGQSKGARVFAELRNMGVAASKFYGDTGEYPGLGAGGQFPDALLNRNAVGGDVQARWRGPYIETIPTCPYSGCRYEVDYNTGAAQQQGQTYQYFIVARNVPLRDALDISRSANGDAEVQRCTLAIVPQVVNGAQRPCRTYLSAVTGGPDTKVDVYYAFVQGTY